MFDEEDQPILRQHLPNGAYLTFILVVGVMAGLAVWSLMSSGRNRAAAEDRDTRGQLQTELRSLVGASALAPAEASAVATYGVPAATPAVEEVSWKWLGLVGLIGLAITLWATVNYYVASTVEVDDDADTPPGAAAEPARVPLVAVPEWMKVAVRTSRDGILGLNASGRILAANPAAEKLLGCGTGKLPGEQAFDYLPEIGVDADALRRFSQVAAPTAVAVHRKDGTVDKVQVALQRVGEKGDTQYVASIFQPEPAVAPAPVVPEAAPVAAAAPVALAETIADPTPAPVVAPLSPAVNEDALHDLENQVVMLSGYSELVVSALGDEHPARFDAEAVSRAAARASLLCHEVAPITRAHPRTVDLNSFVQTLAAPLARVLDEGCEVRGLPGQNPVEVWADPDLLERSVCSLAWRTQELTGALKRVSVSVSAGRIELRMALDGETPPATAAVYDALHAVDWIEAQNGTIELEERSASAVRFRIWLPAAAQPRATRDPGQQDRSYAAAD